MGTEDVQLIAGRDAHADSAVFAKAASFRQLSAANERLQRSQSPSLKRIGSTSLGISSQPSATRRPSTAASVHSRIHEALRRSENEFVFSSKESTVDGFLYSSRFQQTTPTPLRPMSSQTRSKSKTKQLQQFANAAAPPTPSKSPSRSASITKRPSTMTLVPSPSTTELPPSGSKKVKRRSLSSANLLTQQQTETLPLTVKTRPAEASAPPVSAASPSTAAANARLEEAAYMQRKRKCARTFEEMIFARIQSSNNTSSNTGSQIDTRVETEEEEDSTGIEKLLANGIIQSIVTLSTLSDQATQVHCCRALYYLSRIRVARKPMVSNGVVAAIKALARSVTMQARQDLAATLCHLCEEVGLVEAMLFEGLDRCLVRLFATAHPETKRICALAVFNISSDAVKMKHCVETYSQLLITSTKSSYGNTAASSYLMKAVYNVARLPMFHASLLGENIPRFLASQLPHVADEIKILALQALISLCDVKTNRLQILSQGFCKLLEKMLTLSNPEVQERALLVLLLLSIDEGSRIKLCNWVPAATIISSASTRLSDPSASTLIYLDSCIFRNLCDSVLTHHELLEEEAVPLLLQLSRHSDHAIKSNAVCALVSIIASSPEESAEYVVEILDELITLAQSPVHHICLFAVGAIYNIACNDDCLPLLMQSLDLIDCLRELATTVSHDNVAELTAATIYRLATMDVGDDVDPSKSAPVLLMQRGFFPVLVQLIRQFRVARTYAVNTLYMLAQSDNGSTTMFPHGTDEVWQLVCALSDDVAVQKPSVATSTVELDASRSAVTLLAYLAKRRVNHSLLVRNGAVFRYLKSLRRVTSDDSHDETIVLNSAFVFYALTVSQEGCEQLIREQGIEEFIHIARTTKLKDSIHMHHIKELFMMTMCRVSSFIGLEVRLIEHGAIDAVLVLALVSSTDSVSIKGLCIKTLANCLVSKNCARPLIEHGVIWALSSLAVVDSPDTRYACAVSLCNLATVPFMLARFLDAGAPRALIHILQKSEGDNATALVVIKAIANLVANEKICMAFVSEDIEKHLSVFFASVNSSDEMRQLAAMVLLRVTSANDAVISPEHLKHGVFVWMEQIIVMEDDGLVKNCMLTVHDLTCSTTIDVAELDVDYILRILIQVFQRHARSADVLTLCLWVLYNLSCQFTVLHELVRPEIFEFLRQRVPAVALPFPLPSSSCSSTPHLMTSASTLALINGALAQNDLTAAQALDVKLCCLILHNLSCAKEDPQATTTTTACRQTVLASLVNARGADILSDIYLQRDDLKETCAITVCNLAIGRVNSTRIVQDRAGELVIHFVFSSLFHRCHYHVVSVAIRKMVNAPGNQNVLLHRGIGRAIVHVLELAVNNGAQDIETTRNLMASLSVLCKCKAYLPQLLQDGALPIVITVSESRAVNGPGSGSSNGLNSEILGYCFEVLSELCSINFEAFAPTKLKRAVSRRAGSGDDSGEINVINTLTRLSELHHLHCGSVAPTAGPLTYYERGDDGGKTLAYAQLLTFMKKSPASTNSVKKNLELQATFQVPARKWMPDAQPTPRDPPPLECAEIPMTEGSQSIPNEIKEKIKGLPALGKEPLVRDETNNNGETVSGAATPQQPPGTPETHDDADSFVEMRPMSRIQTLGARHSTAGKKLQRGLAGRNLSLTGSSTLLQQ